MTCEQFARSVSHGLVTPGTKGDADFQVGGDPRWDMLRNRLTGDPMNRRGLLMVLSLLVGCARGSADLLDASIGPIQGSDGGTSDSGDAVDDQADDVDEGSDGDDQADNDGVDGDGVDGNADSDGTDADADADGAEMDAAVPDDDDGDVTPQPIEADFRVRQRNAALAEPLATNLQLDVGDTLRITGGGNIWPGLVFQGCCGPTGTSGTHSGSDWPLQGGPDFALVAFVNGAWTFVGSDRTFDITVAGPLQLGTNDNDPGTGDDCNDVAEGERGFSAHVVITPAN
jgi:hypothetical protein